MDADIRKLKRQIRDWYNKTTNDQATLLKVASVINFPTPNKDKEDDNHTFGKRQ